MSNQLKKRGLIMRNKAPSPDKNLAAVCGLFCPSCNIYIATHEDPDRLKQLAQEFQISEEAVKCDGCRSEKRLPYCATCKMAACAAEKGIDFCGACEAYPCDTLKEFQAARPHRIELWKNQKQIRENGYRHWFETMIEHYSCQQCQTLNSAYDLSCRKCGHWPSCTYVRLHQDEIVRSMNNSGS
jgi:hypothetical protein